ARRCSARSSTRARPTGPTPTTAPAPGPTATSRGRRWWRPSAPLRDPSTSARSRPRGRPPGGSFTLRSRRGGRRVACSAYLWGHPAGGRREAIPDVHLRATEGPPGPPTVAVVEAHTGGIAAGRGARGDHAYEVAARPGHRDGARRVRGRLRGQRGRRERGGAGGRPHHGG